MAVDVVYNNISSGYNLTKLNENWSKSDVAFQDCFSLSGTNNLTIDIDANNHSVINLAEPSNAKDAATKDYVDGIAGFGVIGPIGPIGLVWRGDWVVTNYVTNEAVSYLGSSYICAVDTVSNELPTDVAFWDLLATKGVDGSLIGPGLSTLTAIPVYNVIDGTSVINTGVLIDSSNNLVVPGTVNTRDIGVDGTKLDTIATGASADIVGEVRMYSGSVAPTGWLFCDGAAYSRTVTYDVLFGVIGTLYGVGDGSTTFNVPDLNGRSAIGTTATPGSAPDATAHPLGQISGEETHTLTIPEMPIHGHPIAGGAASTAGTGPNRETPGPTGTISGVTGGGLAHNIMQPSLSINFIIKY